MAKTKILTERGTQEKIYPHTISEAVWFNDGQSAERKMAALGTALVAKQGRLSTSEDLSLSAADELSLTDTAKREWIIRLAQARGAKYDSAGGVFSLNGVAGIPMDEMMTMIRCDGINAINIPGAYLDIQVRTFFPPLINCTGWCQSVSHDCTFLYCRRLEVLKFRSTIWHTKGLRFTFRDCARLRIIDCEIRINVSGARFEDPFYGCVALEEVRISRLSGDGLSFGWSPLLSLESVAYLVENATNTSVITVAVHPDTYAKLTGDTTNAAAAALTEEQLQKWRQVLTNAAGRNISFATV